MVVSYPPAEKDKEIKCVLGGNAFRKMMFFLNYSPAEIDVLGKGATSLHILVTG